MFVTLPFNFLNLRGVEMIRYMFLFASIAAVSNLIAGGPVANSTFILFLVSNIYYVHILSKESK